MIITFKELGIDTAQFNGMRAGLARAILINAACDYAMHYHFSRCNATEEECLLNVPDTTVDFTLQTVTLETVDFPTH